MTVPALAHTTDVSRGAWVRPLLGPWGGGVTSQVPQGYDAYVRVFHAPGERSASPETWASVAARNGRTWHPLMQWESISGPTDDPPALGTLGERQWVMLAGALGHGTPVTAGLWVGYGNIGPNASVSTLTVGGSGRSAPVTPGVITTFGDVRSQPLLELPNREYALFTGMLSTLRSPTWRRDSGWAWFWDETVNLLWPDDRSWFVASEIDFDSTLVGCSAATAARILECALEAAIVPPDGDLARVGDLINRSR